MITESVFCLLTTFLFYLFQFSELAFLRTEIVYFILILSNSYASSKFILPQTISDFKHDLSKAFSLLFTR